MKNYFKDKTYLKLERRSPYYICGHDRCLKVYFKNIFGFSLARRVDGKEFNEETKEKLLKVFDRVEELKAYKNGQTYFLSDAMWIVKKIDYLETTENAQVMFDKKNQAYIGYSHRGHGSFKIGDMLFDNTDEYNQSARYYCNKKMRWKFLKRLLKYHFTNNSFMFSDLVKYGLSEVISFNQMGIKKIEMLSEAYEAACNFAKFLS